MRIKELRQNCGLNQKDLANKLNRSQSCVCDWENGRREPSISDLIKMSEIFNCSVDYLIENENDSGFRVADNMNLTGAEARLLSSFNLLSADDQNKVIGFIKALEK
ncbi:MAG: helix-turn-helix transcriptional regulator [Clostridia bacterium]|nr:helix-turn-helix transcriptional regulator [Clostridia bacterium]